MSEDVTPENTLGGEADGPTGPPASEGERRQLHEMWAAGTEEPTWVVASTAEGAQNMLPRDQASSDELAQGDGTLVTDDRLYDEEVSGEETTILNMGPHHPSTHGVLRLQLELDGETVRRVKPIIGYLHTGMEKTGETLTFMQGPTNVTRMDYLAPFNNELCFSLATEALLGIELPPRARAIRVLMTELDRVASHLVWVATQGLDLAALSVMIYGIRDRELLLAFFEKTTGLRMLHNYIRPGGVAADLPDGWEEDVAGIIEGIPKGLDDLHDLLTNNPIFLGRTQGVGGLTREECVAYGITGPPLRAAGVDWDLRKSQPYSGIEQYEFDVPLGEHGDVYDRYLVRMEEMSQSLRIVAQVADSMPAGDYRTADLKVTPPPRKRIDEAMEALIPHFKIFPEGFTVPAGEHYQAVEGPRGELGHYLVSVGEAKPWRLHCRAPSFAVVQVLPIMMNGQLIADSIAIIASIDPIMGEVDR